jgi:hypothetical protein
MKMVMWLMMIAVLAGILSVPMPVQAGDDPKETEISGKRVLGKENIATQERFSKRYSAIVIRDISFEGTSIQEVDETKHPDFKDVVKKLGTSVPDTIAAQLREAKLFERVVRGNDASPENAVVLEARFTKITTGNRAARFFVGFGAGSSTVGIEGKLIDRKTGEVLASFENNTHSPMSMGTYQVVLPADGENNGKKIAAFIKKLY